MDEYLEFEKMRLKRKHQGRMIIQEKKQPNKLPWKKNITQVLISIIFVLISAIYICWSKETKEIYKKHVFETNLSFTSINEWYENIFGSSIPIDFTNNNLLVNSPNISINEITKYQDGVMVNVGKESVINAQNSGIVVFIGEKENYGNVVIIQGIDGVDIWYGNITNVNVSLYDYVEKNMLLGSASSDQIYYVIQKDGTFLDYEEYKSQI